MNWNRKRKERKKNERKKNIQKLFVALFGKF